MSCPTCSHTMQNLGVEAQRIFWCPRCGTVQSVHCDDMADVSAPKLVDRVREVDATARGFASATGFIAVQQVRWIAVRAAAGIKPRGT